MPKLKIKETKKIVLVGGVFDILHFGHVHFLKEAKRLGDYLIVIIESDKRVKKLKGDTRPFHNQNQRKEILESLKFVDEVIILKDDMTDQDYENIVKNIHPQIIAITRGAKTITHSEVVGANVIEIDNINVPSTTQIAKIIGIE